MKQEDELPVDITMAMAAGVAAQPLPAQTHERIRDRLMQRVRATACETESETIRAGEGQWFDVAPKVRLRVLHYDRGAAQVSFLLQLAPGAVVPAHEHSCDEECIVLDGEVAIDGLTLTAGDFHLARKGHPHGTMSSSKGSTLYLRGEVRPFHQPALAVAS